MEIYAQTSEKYQVYLNIFYSECRSISTKMEIYAQTSEKVNTSEWKNLFLRNERRHTWIKSNIKFT